jgi:hypothetical protein
MSTKFNREDEDAIVLFCYKHFHYKIDGPRGHSSLGGYIDDRGQIFCGSDFAGQVREVDNKTFIRLRDETQVALTVVLNS